MKQDNPTVLKSPEAGPYGREGRGEPSGVRRLCVALELELPYFNREHTSI